MEVALGKRAAWLDCRIPKLKQLTACVAQSYVKAGLDARSGTKKRPSRDEVYQDMLNQELVR